MCNDIGLWGDSFVRAMLSTTMKYQVADDHDREVYVTGMLRVARGDLPLGLSAPDLTPGDRECLMAIGSVVTANVPDGVPHFGVGVSVEDLARGRPRLFVAYADGGYDRLGPGQFKVWHDLKFLSLVSLVEDAEEKCVAVESVASYRCCLLRREGSSGISRENVDRFGLRAGWFRPAPVESEENEFWHGDLENLEERS